MGCADGRRKANDDPTHLAGCRLKLFSSNRTTYCSNYNISEGICSVGGVDRGRLTPYYPSKCSESRAESVPLVKVLRVALFWDLRCVRRYAIKMDGKWLAFGRIDTYIPMKMVASYGIGCVFIHPIARFAHFRSAFITPQSAQNQN